MINRDWSQGNMTAGEIKKEWPQLEFRGPGWYYHSGDTMLVLKDEKREDNYTLYCWNNQDGREMLIDIFADLMKLPNFFTGRES